MEDIKSEVISGKINKGTYFYIKKKITEEEKAKIEKIPVRQGEKFHELVNWLEEKNWYKSKKCKDGRFR